MPGAGLSNLLTRALGVPLDSLVAQTNDPRFLTGVIPAANIVITANELSRFYELMGAAASSTASAFSSRRRSAAP